MKPKKEGRPGKGRRFGRQSTPKQYKPERPGVNALKLARDHVRRSTVRRTEQKLPGRSSSNSRSG